MKNRVFFKGRELTLSGRHLEPGDHAPDFIVFSGDLREFRCSDLAGKIRLITCFPSVDTSVCADQVKEFNRRALAAGSGVAVLGISMDLPFAQKRFCEENAITGMRLYSDCRDASFGSSYGILVEELRILARGVFIVDAGGTLRFSYYTDELSDPVDFDAVAAALDEVVRQPEAPGPVFPWRCIPCENASSMLEPGRLDMLLAQSRDWKRGDGAISKEFDFRDFNSAMRFAGLVAAVAEEEKYVPSLAVSGNRLTVRLSSGGGLTENELIMSRIIDEILF